MFTLDGLSVPIVQAPMAGGPSTVELAAAVCEAGGLGFLAAGYRRADQLGDDISRLRARAGRAFGVNIFVPAREPADPEAVRRYAEELAPEAERHGVPLGEPRFDDDDWAAKLDVVCETRVPVVSFTFGCPADETVSRLHERGIAVWVTVGNAGEARQAESVGADALVVQGLEAGGHRGGFVDDAEAGGTGLLALLQLVRRAVSLPMIATGGIADGAAVAAVLCAGAAAAQIGTALMLAPEAGTAPAQRALLTRELPTALTRAFSGRLARGIVNRFQSEHTETAPSAYPEIHHVTSPLRADARRRGDADMFNLWAGQAHELARELPAAEIIRAMVAEAREALAGAARTLEA
jgi:nitronate monooxygenase